MITVSSEPKKEDRASVVVQVVGNKTPEANEAAKAAWRDILNQIVSVLEQFSKFDQQEAAPN